MKPKFTTTTSTSTSTSDFFPPFGTTTPEPGCIMNRPDLNEYLTVPGWCSEIEAKALQDAARGKHVLEIGVWKGRSTIAMAATAASILSVDHFLGDDYAGKADPRIETVSRLRPYQDIVTLCIGKWNKLPINPSQFGFIYYDADHTYEATKEFLEWIYTYPLPRPIYAIHDVDQNPNHAGVKKALHEFTTIYSLHDRLAIVS
jgi:predicted O-methyltransferase YrrM